MNILPVRILFFWSLTLMGMPGATSQEQRGPLRDAFRILVFVRNVDNSSAPAGIGVRLEVDGGGLMDEQSTDSSGKVLFHPTINTGYTVVIHQPGYADDAKHVDLTITPTASASLQLKPLRGYEGQVANIAGTSAISARMLAIPEAARKEYEAGKKLLEEKHDASGSAGHFRKAIKEYEKFPEAYTLLGLAYLQDQKLPDSKAAFDRAIQLDPQSGASYVGLGGCLNQMKDYPGAEKALAKGLEIIPESPDGNYELAKTYWAMHRWQEAQPHAEKAEKLQPNVPGVHVLMGNILLQKQDAAGALKEFHEYLRLDPNGPMSEAVRGVVSKLEKGVSK
jgi:Flp pilus assembly protein TadD